MKRKDCPDWQCRHGATRYLGAYGESEFIALCEWCCPWAWPWNKTPVNLLGDGRESLRKVTPPSDLGGS